MQFNLKKYLDIIEKNGTFIIILFALIGLFGTTFILSRTIRPNFEGKKVVDMIKLQKENYCLFVPEIVVPMEDGSLKKKHVTPLRSGFSVSNSVILMGSLLTLNRNPKLLIWILIFSIMVATALGFVLPLIYQIFRIVENHHPSTKRISTCFIFTVLISLGVFQLSTGKSDNILEIFEVIDKFHVLLLGSFTVKILVAFVITCGLVPIFGMLLIHSCINSLAKKTGHSDRIVERFGLLNESLTFFLTISSVLIMFSIASTSFLQQSINSILEIKDAGTRIEIFPSDFIYAYGLIFTIFLAIIYIPVYQQLKMKGKLIKEQLESLNSEYNLANDDLAQLEMKDSALKRIQVFASILAPILGSVITEGIKLMS
jgi:hypothetical protein